MDEDEVRRAHNYEREFQSSPIGNKCSSECNEAEGKRVRKVLTKYFDP